jgi:hypothetical protein
MFSSIDNNQYLSMSIGALDRFVDEPQNVIHREPEEFLGAMSFKNRFLRKTRTPYAVDDQFDERKEDRQSALEVSKQAGDKLAFDHIADKPPSKFSEVSISKDDIADLQKLVNSTEGEAEKKSVIRNYIKYRLVSSEQGKDVVRYLYESKSVNKADKLFTDFMNFTPARRGRVLSSILEYDASPLLISDLGMRKILSESVLEEFDKTMHRKGVKSIPIVLGDSEVNVKSLYNALIPYY